MPKQSSVRYVFDPGQKEGLMTHADPFGSTFNVDLNHVCQSDKSIGGQARDRGDRTLGE